MYVLRKRQHSTMKQDVRHLLCRSGLAFLCLLAALCALDVRVSAQKAGQGSAKSENRLDVVALLFPESADRVRVGLNYGRKVPHHQAQQEIETLAKQGGWQIEKDIAITDDKLGRNDAGSTGANFVLSQADKLTQGNPTLLPFLQAFQSWNHIQLLLQLPSSASALPDGTFSQSAITIRRTSEGKNSQLYDAEIRDHKATLTEPVFISDAEKQREASAAPPPKSFPLLMVALILAGGGAAGGLAAYLIMARREKPSGDIAPTPPANL